MMNPYELASLLTDFSTSTKNRKRIVSSIEIGFGLLFLAVGIGTAFCEVLEVESPVMEMENRDEEYFYL